MSKVVTGAYARKVPNAKRTLNALLKLHGKELGEAARRLRKEDPVLFRAVQDAWCEAIAAETDKPISKREANGYVDHMMQITGWSRQRCLAEAALNFIQEKCPIRWTKGRGGSHYLPKDYKPSTPPDVPVPPSRKEIAKRARLFRKQMAA